VLAKVCNLGWQGPQANAVNQSAGSSRLVLVRRDSCHRNHKAARRAKQRVHNDSGTPMYFFASRQARIGTLLGHYAPP
jgi:hypothetical protein